MSATTTASNYVININYSATSNTVPTTYPTSKMRKRARRRIRQAKLAATKNRQSELSALDSKPAGSIELDTPSITPRLLSRPFDDTTSSNSFFSILARIEEQHRTDRWRPIAAKDYSEHFKLTGGHPVSELKLKEEGFLFENEADLAAYHQYAGSFKVITQPHKLIAPEALYRLGRLFSRSGERQTPVTREMCRKTTTLWHGTKIENLRSILTNGLSLANAKSGLLGSGIYLTPDIMKCMSYAQGIDSKYKIIIECTVRLGNVLNNYDDAPTGFSMPKDKTELWKFGYHSLYAGPKHAPSTVWGGATRYREFAVFDPRQVVIERIHVFKRKPDPLFWY